MRKLISRASLSSAVIRGVLGGMLSAGLGLAGVSVAAPASAGVNQGGLVQTNPVNFTPNINNGAVYALLQIGSTMYAGGDFTTVTPPGGGTAVTRRGLVAFNATTGAISSAFAPVFNGAVWTLATDGTSLYVGGSFTTAAGASRPYLAKLNPASGIVDSAFNAGLNHQVTDSKVVAGRLIIGGEFTGALRAVNLGTGANTGYINFAFSSTLGSSAGPVGIYRFAISSAGIMVAIGNFTSVGGQAHVRAVMVDLGAAATLDSWYYAGLEKSCQITNVPNYLRGVDFSPDGSYFVLVSTGRNPISQADMGVALCDVTARFETNLASPARPTWTNYTGGDTLLAVNVTDAAVYVQGHFRWLNNEGGSDSQGPNGVPRSGIGALNITTGRALSWNPGKDRGVGGKVLLSTTAGLWVGSDTAHIGGETRARVALLPR